MTKKLLLIQAARAIVPLLVVLLHTSQFSAKYFDYRFLGMTDIPYSGGVDFFFVLSGFMLYYVFHQDFGKKEKFKAFLLGRLLRIYPVYWCILACIVPIYFLVPDYGVGYETQPWVIVKSFLLFPQEHNPVLGVAWSLVYTVFYYLVFSLLIGLPPWLSRSLIALWLLITACAALQIVRLEPFLLRFMFNAEFLKFALGAFTAHAIMNYSFRFGLPAAAAGIIGFPLCWLNYAYSWFPLDLSVGYTVFSILTILGLSSLDQKKQITLPRFIHHLGSASYAIYLTNQPAISVLSKLFHAIHLPDYVSRPVSASLLIAGAILAGSLTHLFVEKPLTSQLKRRFLASSARTGLMRSSSAA
ncbi:acyltransferase family protein [Paenibacillus sp. y28]|uniref:acyltransferase family protein n=1 Tax=Paenibacillus sp. y28 TaxID=3129110 RepID=UPI00301A1544